MNTKQLEQMKNGKGFIAALDQSGGSTPKALANYGVPEDAYNSEDEMFDMVHEMRTRIVTSPVFDGERILGAILFENTMDRTIEGMDTADYLWEKKGVIPFLKVDKGLADPENGVQLMKPIPGLDNLLDRAVKKNIFGTKMRSVIKEYNEEGIRDIVKQQFDIGKQIAAKGLVPIIEPEVDIHAEDKAKIEKFMAEEIKKQIEALPEDTKIMLKLTIPTEANLYKPLMDYPQMVRIVALSGGYTREDANEKLAENEGMIASFSRALTEGLTAQQSDEEFNADLDKAIQSIYEASIK